MGAGNLARAAASPLVRGRPSSGPAVTLHGARSAAPDHLNRYTRVCGFGSDGTLPATYPHVMAFDLVMRLMTRRDFPFALPGLIHIRNTISAHRSIDTRETLAFRVHAGDVAEHPKGRTVDVLTSATIDGTECWAERSTYLRCANPSPAVQAGTRFRAAAQDAELDSARANARDAMAAGGPDDVPSTVRGHWDLPGTLGRRYARVSGDWNPIHVSLWTARLFGAGRPVAHGMWTMARALSAMDTLPDAFTVDVTFTAPLPLPSRVEFATDGAQLAVRPIDASDARPYLTGIVTRQ